MGCFCRILIGTCTSVRLLGLLRFKVMRPGYELLRPLLHVEVSIGIRDAVGIGRIHERHIPDGLELLMGEQLHSDFALVGEGARSVGDKTVYFLAREHYIVNGVVDLLR